MNIHNLSININYAKYAVVFFFACTIIFLAVTYSIKTAIATAGDPIISSPIIAATHDEIIAATNEDTRVDGPFSTFMCNNRPYSIVALWDHENGGIPHAKMEYSHDDPFGTNVWIKTHEELFGEQVGTGGNWWIVNTYQTASGILALVHVEGADGGPGPGKTRIGLAWSDDCGDTFEFLGNIVKPNDDTDTHNIQGVPYVVKDGYMYIYFHDTPGYMTIARTDLDDAITAATTGNTTTWYKYYQQQGGDFQNDALNTASSSAIGIYGISHNHATYSEYTDKYYMAITRMNWSNQNTWVKLYESDDAINWSSNEDAHVVVNQKASEVASPTGGYQYCSITPAYEGQISNAIVDDKLYVFCQKEASSNEANTLYRWTVYLDEPNDFYRYSNDFSSTQGGSNWYYQEMNNDIYSDMTWNTNYWRVTEAYPQVWKTGGHPSLTGSAVFKWTPPKDGTIYVQGTAYDADSTCGDGVNVKILKDSITLWDENINNGNTIGISHDLEVEVSTSSALYFQIAPNSNHYCDSTGWDPTISYDYLGPSWKLISN